MQSILPVAARGEIVVDHISADGPTATHMRGIMLVSSLQNLREAGFYDRYIENLPPMHREPIAYTIAASWVPIDLMLAHYQACDRMQLDQSQIRVLGKLMADKVADSFLSVALRTLRDAGIETIWRLLAQQGRMWDRMYRGGGVTVLRTGPKDVLFENHGLPLVQSRYFRKAHVEYMRAVSSLFAKVVFTKEVRPREPHPHRIAIAGSWV